jgi:hypothetical protein
MKPTRHILLAIILSVAAPLIADDGVQVELDTSEVPHLKEWGETARDLLIQWHPRMRNLLASKDFKPATKITLKLKKSEEGVAYTSGTTIVVSSHWIEKHPEDLGLVAHELVHIIQAYPSARPSWLTEGIADYLRWAIYEGKPQDWFQRPKEKQGYRQSYRVAGGFLLWLESDLAPGIVKKLNAAMRSRKYSADLFQTETGFTLDELWDKYIQEAE